MRTDAIGRLVILSGPSCVGKSPLRAALAKFYPKLWGSLQKLVLFNSRPPRPGEREGVDYHFRSRTQVEDLRAKEHYAVNSRYALRARVSMFSRSGRDSSPF